MSSPLVTIQSKEELDKYLDDQGKNLTVIHFSAEWADQCSQMNDVLVEISKQHQNVKYLVIDAENLSEVSLEYEIEAVPTFLFMKNKQQIGRLNGAHAPELTKLVKENITAVAPAMQNVAPMVSAAPRRDPKEALEERLKKLISMSEAVLFMKGDKDAPQCGFSRQMVGILSNYPECEYATFDILQDNQVRQGLKEFSNWPTYPQLYVNGELIGGLDIIREMHQDKELEEILPNTNAAIDNKIKKVLSQSKVVLLMKGHPDEPKCGFSRQIVGIMKQTGVEYTHFDIFTDQKFRARIKVYSDWPTFPQLYVKGELIGGLDIVKEMSQNNELIEALNAE